MWITRLLPILMAILFSCIAAAVAQESGAPSEQTGKSRNDAPANSRWEPVTEKFAGSKGGTSKNGNFLSFGPQTFSSVQRRHPAAELSRDRMARDWRSPWCVMWRDGCERCTWSMNDGRVSCYSVTDQPACVRKPILCEDADADLITNYCSVWAYGCNDCSLTRGEEGQLTVPCTAQLCSPSAYYNTGYICRGRWTEARDKTLIRDYRRRKQSQIRTLLDAYRIR